jgi:Coenzyme PQQ synthesis protein D (PqqD)
MISRNPSTIWTKLDGKVVLLNVELARYYEANTLGSLIWEQLEEPCTADDIVERIVSRYRVDREQCQADVSKFLDSLAQVGLLAGKEAVRTGEADPAQSSSE